MMRTTLFSLAASMLVLGVAISGCSAACQGPTATSFPACEAPPPYEVINPQVNITAEFFEACGYISARRLAPDEAVIAFDLGSLELPVAERCYHTVEHVSFGGLTYTPALTNYTQDARVGVKISGEPFLATYEQLLDTPVNFCIRLKASCLDQASVYNALVAFPVGIFEVHGAAAEALGHQLCAAVPINDSQSTVPLPASSPSPSSSPMLTPTPIPMPANASKSARRALASAYPLQHRRQLKDLPSPTSNAGTCSDNPCDRSCGDHSCPSNPPPFMCGTDKPGCDIKQLVAPGGAPSSGSPQQGVVAGFTALDCCRACRDTDKCSTFIIREGVCFLKGYALDQYAPSGTSAANGATCPPSVIAETRVGDIHGSNTIIGSQCSC